MRTKSRDIWESFKPHYQFLSHSFLKIWLSSHQLNAKIHILPSSTTYLERFDCIFFLLWTSCLTNQRKAQMDVWGIWIYHFFSTPHNWGGYWSKFLHRDWFSSCNADLLLKWSQNRFSSKLDSIWIPSDFCRKQLLYSRLQSNIWPASDTNQISSVLHQRPFIFFPILLLRYWYCSGSVL